MEATALCVLRSKAGQNIGFLHEALQISFLLHIEAIWLSAVTGGVVNLEVELVGVGRVGNKFR